MPYVAGYPMMRRFAMLVALLSTITLQGCKKLSFPQSASQDNTIYVGVEPATKELIEGMLAIYEASEELPTTILVLSTLEETITALQREELDFAMILGPPGIPTLFSTPITTETLSAIVPAGSVVTDLSRQQLIGILAGTVTNWHEIGRPDQAIMVISPSEESSIYRALTSHLMPIAEFSTSSLIAFDDSEGVRMVSETPGSIGIVRSNSVTSRVRVLFIHDDTSEKVVPSEQTYFVIESVYFVAHQEPEGEIRQFLKWLLSPTGKQAIEHFTSSPTD